MSTVAATAETFAHRRLKVALIDSVPLLRRGVQTVVGADPALVWVDAVSGARAAIELCERQEPDVVLISSRSDPGWKLCELLTRLFRDLTVVALLGDGARNAEAMARARCHGARSLVPIEADADRLVAAIRLGVDLGDFLDPQLHARFGPVSSVSATRSKPLSRRELEVLHLVAEGRTAVNIAGRLGITPETVRTHVNHLLRKLEARDRAHAVAKAFQMSLLSG
ncbi:helix-turn-helix transcriptional regulator [Lentzea sp. NBRC 105346]|uniref:response regulator transcription factor n=1 Tax=Lentzea sp. NBRC 105346 TaxID=3032205 RepID=UPI0024A1B504|nr:response regulator transcription factor [Lentzea sp. NBRC 105346]GLZ30114.1 helix-turn-helix transcriptional regulator [Lentzea sp. NBRC 105346]